MAESRDSAKHARVGLFSRRTTNAIARRELTFDTSINVMILIHGFGNNRRQSGQKKQHIPEKYSEICGILFGLDFLDQFGFTLCICICVSFVCLMYTYEPTANARTE